MANRIFILQKCALQIIHRMHSMQNCATLFKEMKILTVPGIYIFESALFVKKKLNMFDKSFDVHSYSTRNCHNLTVFQHSKALFEKCPKYRLVHIYNKLPDNIKAIASLSVFKKTLSMYLLNTNVYCVKDFYL
jgi:hypothetical protein